MPALCCSVEGTHFERGAFRERYPDNNDSISLSESSSKQKSKMAGYCWDSSRIMWARPWCNFCAFFIGWAQNEYHANWKFPCLFFFSNRIFFLLQFITYVAILKVHYYITTLPHYTTLQHYYITTLLHYYITTVLYYYITNITLIYSQ